MRTPILSLLLLTWLGLSACSCPEVRDVRRIQGEHLGTPEAAVWFFQRAFLDGSADNAYLCFAEELKAENPDLDVGVMHTYADRIRRFLEEKIGDLEEVAPEGPGTIDPRNPDVATIVVTDGKVRQTLLLVRERSAIIQWTDGSFTPPIPAANLRGAIHSAAPTFTLSFLHTLRPGATPDDVHRIDYAVDWKFRGLVGGDLGAELKEFIDKERAAEEGAAPSVRP